MAYPWNHHFIAQLKCDLGHRRAWPKQFVIALTSPTEHSPRIDNSHYRLRVLALKVKPTLIFPCKYLPKAWKTRLQLRFYQRPWDFYDSSLFRNPSPQYIIELLSYE